MDGDGEYDPTKPEDEGAAGGGDENPQDYKFPDLPSDPADPAAKQKKNLGSNMGKKRCKIKGFICL